MGQEVASKKDNAAKRGNVSTMLVTSFLWLCICVLCFVSATWAWFSIGVTNRGSLIIAATFDVSVTVVGTENTQLYVDESGRYYLEAENEYTVTLANTASMGSGYCRVTLGEEFYYTPQIEKNTSFSFRIVSPEAVFLQVERFWGSPGEHVNIIQSEEP
ncbi:MAG: hypothetical protein LBS36_01670 [Oscillospiraceae bacterium]|jgi:hypothetical protein|nr:hypothetical protein [Oscillospiraceae bacterium]